MACWHAAGYPGQWHLQQVVPWVGQPIVVPEGVEGLVYSQGAILNSFVL